MEITSLKLPCAIFLKKILILRLCLVTPFLTYSQGSILTVLSVFWDHA